MTRSVLPVAIVLTMLAPGPRAVASDKDAWGAAAVAAGVGALIEASRDRPANAAALAFGAAVAYGQHEKERRTERFAPYPVAYRDQDPYGYDRGEPIARPGSRENDFLFRRDGARYTSSTREVTGVVTATAGVFSRELRVRLDNGETRAIEVPRDARVRRWGDPVSVHEIRRDDVVRVAIDRYTTRGTLRARRVDVLQGFDSPGRWGNRSDPDRRGVSFFTGRVLSIDSREGILRVDADGRRYTVATDRAILRDRRGAITLRDLQKGNRVIIEGRLNGSRIEATRVTLD